ncbi:MAG: hypothetical protein HYV33_05210 [Candidatus Kerfeldbacteria bacterium]|nr:hypothetical protein [Candidatus Kerfeldbacteria bacterium]
MITEHTLLCDPSDPNGITWQYDGQQHYTAQPRADQLLNIIVQLTAGNIDRLVLINQAESFTRIRVLAAIFNTLAFSRNIPLFQNNDTTPVAYILPHYSHSPLQQ